MKMAVAFGNAVKTQGTRLQSLLTRGSSKLAPQPTGHQLGSGSHLAHSIDGQLNNTSRAAGFLYSCLSFVMPAHPSQVAAGASSIGSTAQCGSLSVWGLR